MTGTIAVERAFDVQAELGEGPLWDGETGCLYFVDITRGRVHRYEPERGTCRWYDAGAMVGAVALAESGDLVLARRGGFARLNPHTGRADPIAAVDADRPELRMNDGACDAAGRFWAGTMAIDERPRAGALYRLDPDLRVHTMARDISISNGIDWTLDGRGMYYVDTPTRSIDVFDFDAASGAISNRRSLVAVPRDHGWPDGLTVDADGFIWVAFWGGGAVRRYAPDGSLAREIAVPATHPTACAFGGRELRDLYITTATIALSPDARARQPLAGSLLRCRPGVQGRAPFRFKG